MRVLLVEDDEGKRRQISEWLMVVSPDTEIGTAKSLQSGLRALVSEQWSLVILDMTLPTFDITVDEPGGRPQAYGGRELLRQMVRRQITAPAVVVTQFDRFGQGSDERTLDELNAELAEINPSYLGAVYYSASYDSWKEDLQSILSRVSSEEEPGNV